MKQHHRRYDFITAKDFHAVSVQRSCCRTDWHLKCPDH